MSSRRKRAPPVRVDEEAKKRLEWNMLEDRRNEVILLEDENSTDTIEQTQSSSLLHATNNTASSSTVHITEELPCTSTHITSTAPSPSVTVVPVSQLGPIWKALIGEFTVQPSWLPSDFEQRMFSIQRKDKQICLSYSRSEESSGPHMGPFEEDTYRAECSLSRISLVDLDWLLQRRVVQLCHQAKRDSFRV